MSRAHNNLSKEQIISFCRENIKFFDELYEIVSEDRHVPHEDIDYVYKEWNRRRRNKGKEIIPILREKLGYKEPWQALYRMLWIYKENINEIKGIREDGYYWVKYQDEWIIIESYSNQWNMLNGDNENTRRCLDEDFQAIDNIPITRK